MSKGHWELPYKLEDTYILQFGKFYFYEKFVVSEIGENITYDGYMVNMVEDLINSHYGHKKNIGYISNRVNNYIVSKHAWSKFLSNSERFNGYATVPSSKESLWNKMRNINKSKFEKAKFNTLLEAASWVTSLNILLKNKKLAKGYIPPPQNNNHFL